MADKDKNKKPDNLEPKNSVPTDAELFAGDVQNDYTAQDIFAGDDSLFRTLAEPTQPGNDTPASRVANSLRQLKPKLSHLPGSRVSLLQKGLVSAILLVASILAVAVFKTPKNSLAKVDPTPPLDLNVPSGTPQALHESDQNQAELAHNMATPIDLNDTQEAMPEPLALDAPLSLRVAQDLFEAGQYRRAYGVYHQIQQYLPLDNSDTAYLDFLNLHKGLCLTMNQESIKARRSLAVAVQSQIPSIRVMANYYLSVLDLSQNQFMPARSEACAALALSDALRGQDPEWVTEFKQTCRYLVAEATSKQALILCNADKQIPLDLCPTLPLIATPWHKLNETQIRDGLSKEVDLLPSVLLLPSFSADVKKPQSPWSVSCHRMAVDELLARFGAAMSLEVVWHDEANSPSLRKQAISLYVKDVSDQAAVSLAAGSAGPAARISDDRTIHVRHPMTAALVSDQVAMLAQEGTAMWQRYLFSNTESPYFSVAHFISGLLYKQLSLKTEALSEFKLVASRYSRSRLAPYALLHSSQVKEELRDAFGVKNDLELLVEQYPDVPIVTEAYMRLAQTVATLGDNKEAAELFQKVLFLNLSEESKVTAAFNAGRCFYRTKEYDSAEECFIRYIRMAKGRHVKEIYSAYFILGQSLMARGKHETACQAFREALKGELSKEDYLESMTGLVEGYMAQQDLMEAIDVLEGAFNPKLAPSDNLELDLLKSKVWRSAGFVDRSIALLQGNKGSVSNLQLNARLSYDLSLSFIEKGQLAQAQKELSGTLIKVGSGPLANKIALTLAQVCLDLNQDAQAVSVCQGVLKLWPDPVLKQQTEEILAKAYTNQRNYDKAAQALIGQGN